MATIKPFAALRPDPALAGRICEPPYDVLSSEEARRLAADNPFSFLHVSKPEIDLPPGTDLYASEVYAKGRENFERLRGEGALKPDARPAFYFYRQIQGQHSQTGLVAVVSCEEYLRDTIRRHELTRPDKETDRVRHIEALNAQTGPVFLTYRAEVGLDELIARRTGEPPEVDFTARDGVRHSSWSLGEPEAMVQLQEAFDRVPLLYIADGHHRSAAAVRVYRSRLGQGGSAWFLAVIFPHDQMQILPYNRVLKDLNGLTAEMLLKRLDGIFIRKAGGEGTPTRRHELGLYQGGRWQTLSFRPQFAATTDPIEKLDVTLLQQYVLAPIFGIDDPRTSRRIQFVGGIRGTAELERLVDRDGHGCAFSLFPTGIEELMTIAEAGGLMPPKSTWFEPKLRDGMFCHLI